MIRRIKGIDFTPSLLERNVRQDQAIEEGVRTILADVKLRGNAALREYTLQFDGATLSDFRTSASEMESAYRAVGTDFIALLNEAASNIRSFHNLQIRKGFEIQGTNGIFMGQRFTPIHNVGIYVPGGTAPYPSTVLMDSIPALIAGVHRVVMMTPPDRDGRINDGILAAAKVAGITEIYKLGGAQAIAALAYGTESIPRVDKIVGPGNIYVATAKKQVYGTVDIDMIAGPSDILIIADDTANPKYVAADMLGQSEHDVRARAVLISLSHRLSDAVFHELADQLKILPRAAIAAQSIENNGLIIDCDHLEQAVDIADTIAPEHLEICTADPMEAFQMVHHAGSIFLGHYTPEALGDYFAGPNHTLPTDGTARFYSPLSVDDFLKKSSYLHYTQQALAAVGEKVMDFAHHEKLDAHANSIAVRLHNTNR